MSTLQDVVNLARLDLNDALVVGTATVTPRYPDSDLLKFANDGIALAYVVRPDLKYGDYATPYSDLTLSDPFPLPIEYRPAVSDYIVARNQSGDDEFVIQQRAEQAMAGFAKGLGLGGK